MVLSMHCVVSQLYFTYPVLHSNINFGWLSLCIVRYHNYMLLIQCYVPEFSFLFYVLCDIKASGYLSSAIFLTLVGSFYALCDTTVLVYLSNTILLRLVGCLYALYDITALFYLSNTIFLTFFYFFILCLRTFLILVGCLYVLCDITVSAHLSNATFLTVVFMHSVISQVCLIYLNTPPKLSHLLPLDIISSAVAHSFC